MSDHSIRVVRLGPIEKHPNADTLGITRIWGFTCLVRLGDMQEGDLVAYIIPDSICPETPEFAFLGKHRRIGTKKLRGVVSQGLLVKAPEGSSEGDDVAELLGITHYEPEAFHGVSHGQSHSFGKSLQASPPSGFYPIYDVENWRRYKRILKPGELIEVTEKLHGCLGRYVFRDGEIHCGSHRTWKKPEESCLWWKVFNETEWLQEFVGQNPSICVYGEVFGQVMKGFDYGVPEGKAELRVFDLWDVDAQKWLEGTDERYAEIPETGLVPLLYVGPYDPDTIETLSEGKTTLAGHIREGVVIRTLPEREEPHFGRCQLKLVSNEYLGRS